jgi:hypothetical protein
MKTMLATLLVLSVTLSPAQKMKKSPKGIGQTGCGENIIVVNKKELPTNWDIALQCNIIADLVYVDLDKIPENDARDARAGWLKTHQRYINFYESYRFIEKTHRIGNPEVIEKIKSNAHFLKIKLKDLKGKINNIQPADPSRYDDGMYEAYIAFAVDTNSVEVRLANFRHNEPNFSIPMLRSIDEVNRVNNDDEIEVAIVDLEKDKVASRNLVIRVKGTEYYDISNEPSR